MSWLEFSLLYLPSLSRPTRLMCSIERSTDLQTLFSSLHTVSWMLVRALSWSMILKVSDGTSFFLPFEKRGNGTNIMTSRNGQIKPTCTVVSLQRFSKLALFTLNTWFSSVP